MAQHLFFLFYERWEVRIEPETYWVRKSQEVVWVLTLLLPDLTLVKGLGMISSSCYLLMSDKYLYNMIDI